MADTGTIGRIGGILKTVYASGVIDQQNLKAESWERYGKADSFFRAPGAYFAFAARLAGMRGAIAPTASDDPLLQPVEINDKQFTVFDRAYNLQFKFYEKDLRNAERDWQAFTNTMKEKMSTAPLDMKKVINIDFLAGDGSGVLSLINAAATASTTITLQVGTGWFQNGSRYLMQGGGDQIDVYDPTLTISRTGGTGVYVTQVTPSVNGGPATAVLSAAVTVQANDIVVRAGGRVNKSFIGLKAATDNAATSFQGLSRATYPILSGNVIPGNGTLSLSETLLQQLQDVVEIRSGKMLTEFLVGHGQWAQYMSLGWAQKRFTNNGKLDKGFQTADFNGVPFRKDVDVPPYVVYGLIDDIIKYGEVRPMGMLDEDGSVLSKDPGYMRYYAILAIFGNFCYTNPNQLGRIDGLLYNTNGSVYVQ